MREDGGERRSIAFAGSVKPHKGGGLLPEIIRRSGDVAQWHVFGGGDAELLEPLRRLPRTSVHGYYRAGTLPSHLARNGVGLLVIPSIVPETFSLVLSEAWLAGVPVIAFDAGAPAERIRRDGGGWLVPLEEGAEGIAAVARKWLSGNLATDVPAKVPTGSEAALATIETYRELQLL